MQLGLQKIPTEYVSRTEIYDALVAASSQCQSQTLATTNLEQLLDKFGTYDVLHEFASQKSIPTLIRQQALIQFKNSALGHWRSRKLLSDELRIRIRNRCLTFLDEEDETIAQLNEIIVPKIARQDFPINWPNLMTELMTFLDSNLQKRYMIAVEDSHCTLKLRRGLKLLHSILKEFASMKMPNGIKIMSKVVDDLSNLLYGYYSTVASKISAGIMDSQSLSMLRVYGDVLLGHLVYKSVSKIATWSWNRIDRVPATEQDKISAWISNLFQSSVLQIKTIAELRGRVMTFSQQPAAEFSSTCLIILSRHLRGFGKFFRRLQQLSPTRFIALPMCSELIMFYWSQIVDASNGPEEQISDSDEAVYPVRFLVQGMVLFKESLAQWAPDKRNKRINNYSLSQEFVQNAAGLLVSRFIPLKPGDLEKWMADPEEWVIAEDREDELWEFELRPCSERVLAQLCQHYSDYVTPLLVMTFEKHVGQCPTDLPSVIQKEALYCAIGRCSTLLKDKLPFDRWLECSLSLEARESNSSYPLIKRRIAWVIGKWVANQCTSPCNPKIWDVLIHLLMDRGAGTDAVVRLTSAMAIGECVNNIDFDPKTFEPFLPVALSELILLMCELDGFESKRRIDFTLKAVIEQTGGMIAPFVGIITESFPSLWSQACDQWLFKSSLLSTISRVIESIKAESTSLGHIIVPLVRESISSVAATHLDEDGLSLWAIALRNTLTFMSVNGAPALFDLLPQALELLSTKSELLGLLIDIVESYVLLDAPLVLQVCRHELFSAFLDAFKSGAAAPLNASDMLKTLELIVQTTSSDLWGEVLHTSGLFGFIVDTLIDDKAPTLVLTEHICFLSRVAIVDIQMFLRLMSAASEAKSVEECFLYNDVLDQWYLKFDNMIEPRNRKLTAMGIAALVSTCRADVLERLSSEIFNLWLDVFYEIKEARIANEKENANDDSTPSPTSLRRYWELDEAPASFYRNAKDTPEYYRRNAVYNRDPIRTVHLGTFVGTQLRQAESVFESELFHTRYLSKCEAGVLSQIQAEIARA